MNESMRAWRRKTTGKTKDRPEKSYSIIQETDTFSPLDFRNDPVKMSIHNNKLIINILHIIQRALSDHKEAV